MLQVLLRAPGGWVRSHPRAGLLGWAGTVRLPQGLSAPPAAQSRVHLISDAASAVCTPATTLLLLHGCSSGPRFCFTPSLGRPAASQAALCARALSARGRMQSSWPAAKCRGARTCSTDASVKTQASRAAQEGAAGMARTWCVRVRRQWGGGANPRTVRRPAHAPAAAAARAAGASAAASARACVAGCAPIALLAPAPPWRAGAAPP